MRSHARVVIVGGGIGGVSTLYHLTQEGWSDAVLVERDELTSGSTWHAAAQVTQFGSNQTMCALKRHSINLYRELAADLEYPINYHITGGMRLAYTQNDIDTYRHFIGMAGGIGVEMEFIDPQEISRRHPLMRTHDLLGAWWDPLDGDIDPAQLVFSLARHARKAGAEICRFNAAQAITKKSNGEFIVHTQKGDITCEIVVNAAGYRVHEVGHMLGVVHPVVSMEHQYFLTEPITAIEALDFRVPIIRDRSDSFYSRQEKTGLLVGVYEHNCKPFGMDGIDPKFTKSLCPSDLDRCLDNMAGIFKRLPALTDTGIHTVINGPITYSADGAPLVGPIPGIRNAYACLGLRAGIGEGGGLGKVLAELIVHGESEWDAWHLDPRRFSAWVTVEATRAKAIEEYQQEFDYHLPHEYRAAARNLSTTPLYAELSRQHCAWGVVNGWERALFFKPDANFIDEHSYRFTPTFDVVAAEVNGISNGVGLMEVSGFGRFEIRGPGAGNFLDRLTCSELPKNTGAVKLCYFLNENGHVLSEATVAKCGDDYYWYGCAAAAEWHDRDWLHWHKPTGVSVIERITSHTTLVIAGPDSRALLASACTGNDCSNQTFRPMQNQSMTIANAQVIVMRVSYSGELAYELHVPNTHLIEVYEQLRDAGRAFRLVQFGLYAAESMRLEKGYLHWKADLVYEHNPFEAGLERFVVMDKENFIGRESLAKQRRQGSAQQLTALTVDCDHAPAHSGDPIFLNGIQVGSVTSGGYGHRVQKNIAFAYIEAEAAKYGARIEVGILGQRYAGAVSPRCLFDRNNQRVRS